MERRELSSSRQKWREGFQKSKSQSSITTSRKSSLFEAETSDQELQEYLDTLKKKSGIKRLWSGERFDKVVRDEEDKTPDISISSSEDEKHQDSIKHKESDSDDDFRPNIVMLPESPSLNDDQSEDSGELFKGVQLADFPLTDDDDDGDKHDDEKSPLNNETKSLSTSETKEINVILNNLQLASEVDTDDDVIEEIEDEIDEVLSDRHKTPEPIESSNVYSIDDPTPRPAHSPRDQSTPTGRRSRNKGRSHSNATLDHSYTMDFSTGDEASVIEEKTESFSSSKSKARPSSRSRSNSLRSHRSGSRSNSSRSKSTSSQSSESYSKSKRSHQSSSRKNKESRNKNKHLCDASVQTGLDLGAPPPGLGVGMATVNQKLGMQFVDPSPIATHVVSAEALEAITAYNPAVVALTDMLKQQIRLVQQFVDTNTRMYQAYTSNLNCQYQYTTLEDTLEFIRKNKPKKLSMKEALRQVKEEDL